MMILIEADLVVENAETFRVLISSSDSSVVISNNSAGITILDDDREQLIFVDRLTHFRQHHSTVSANNGE